MSKRDKGARGVGTAVVKSKHVRSVEVLKQPTVKKDPATGMAIPNKEKWQKRYLVLSDTIPHAALYYWKDSGDYGMDKEPAGFVNLDRSQVTMESGEDKYAGATVLRIKAVDRELVVMFDVPTKGGPARRDGADWFTDIESRCATGDVLANATIIQARFRARGEQKEFEAQKAAAGTMQALTRGKATRDKLALEALPFRVGRIVNAMDTQEDGVIAVGELAQFFEVLAFVSNTSKGPTPKKQATGICAKLTGSDEATEVPADDVAEFLLKTFDSPSGAGRLAKIERAMLMTPIGARVMIMPDGPDRQGSFAEYSGQKGILLSYYNEEAWCYVALDGEGPEDSWDPEDRRKKPFKVEVVVDDPDAIPEAVPPGGGGMDEEEDEVDDYADDEVEEADAIVDDDE